VTIATGTWSAASLLPDGPDELCFPHPRAALDPEPRGFAPELGHGHRAGAEPVPLVAPRLRAAAFEPSRPRAVRVFFDSFVIVFFLRAPTWAFLTFLRAAARCLVVAISVLL
jgi:hypothetical protein